MCKVPPCLFLAQMGPLSAPGAAGLNLACPSSAALGRCFTSCLPSLPPAQPKGSESGGGRGCRRDSSRGHAWGLERRDRHCMWGGGHC